MKTENIQLPLFTFGMTLSKLNTLAAVSTTEEQLTEETRKGKREEGQYSMEPAAFFRNRGG